MNEIIILILVTIFYGVVYSLKPDMYGFKSPLDPFYFSFTTMSSVGYGDFSPKTDLAKMIVMSQQLLIIVGVMKMLGIGRNYLKKLV